MEKVDRLKRAFHFGMKDGPCLRSQIAGIAGSRLKGTIVESFTILTTTPNGLLRDRMLVILH